ncbi:hypothetical protein Nepgr_020049 [Nepenthes gracilis]|uniref:Uncharacterized protein n=1 Tax=Nepenthes gracilis TaxID=150966 RepID=A0AAD3XUX8_NEPGR|nr:hypothetical protein Nepgr_020049 [Nepenthes gracilis]
MLVGDFIIEEALPPYETILNNAEGIQDITTSCTKPSTRWTYGWTAKENRHGDFLNRYLYLLVRVDLRSVEKTVHYLSRSGVREVILAAIYSIPSSSTPLQFSRTSFCAIVDRFARSCIFVFSRSKLHLRFLSLEASTAIVSSFDLVVVRIFRTKYFSRSAIFVFSRSFLLQFSCSSSNLLSFASRFVLCMLRFHSRPGVRDGDASYASFSFPLRAPEIV